MIFLIYAVLAVLVVYCAIKLSYYVDCLDKTTNLSGAFIGGVLLAAITSLPEVFTSLTAILLLDQPHLVPGNVLGSNLFNLSIIAIIVVFTSKNFAKSTLSKSHITTIIFDIVMCILVALAIFVPITIPLGFTTINLMSILMLIVYIISIFLMKNDDSTNDENTTVDLTLKQIITRFILFAIALVFISILLTQASDILAKELNLGATLAGAVFLGVVTSLPELSASINLVRINNYNAAVGNVVGSCLFNFMILCASDFVYSNNIYFNETSVIALLGFGCLSTILTLILIKVKNNRILSIILSVFIILSYILSLALSA